MSGPKISKYTLDPKMREILIAQGECDSKILKYIARIKSMEKQIAALVDNDAIHDNYGSGESVRLAKNLKEKMKEIEQSRKLLADKFCAFSGYTRSSKVIISEKELQRKKNILEKVKSIKNDTEKLLKEAKKNERQWLKLKSQIFVDIQDNWGSAFDLSWETFDEDVVSSKKDHVILLLNNVLSNPELSAELRAKVQNAMAKANDINHDDFLKNFCALTVKPLIDECQAYIKNIETYGDEFKELEAEYKILCTDAHVTPRIFEVSRIGIIKLKTEIVRLKEDVFKQREQEYISDAIDEVMKEMGYDLIGSREVTKKNGKRFRDVLYTFGEGTAVNIRYDNQGKIAMELGGIDSTDRLPSSAEALRLEDEMIAFCDEFTEFESRLERKGIISKDRIRHLPPKAEYAQIINVSDYSVITNTKTFKVKQSTTKCKRNGRKEL